MTYEYECQHCGHRWEEEQKITDPKTEECPACKLLTARRLIAGSGAFVLVGKWFRTGGY